MPGSRFLQWRRIVLKTLDPVSPYRGTGQAAHGMTMRGRVMRLFYFDSAFVDGVAIRQGDYYFFAGERLCYALGPFY